MNGDGVRPVIGMIDVVAERKVKDGVTEMRCDATSNGTGRRDECAFRMGEDGIGGRR